MLKRDILLSYIRSCGGMFPLETAATVVYGNATRGSIARCRTLISDLVKAGVIRRAENRLIGWGESYISVEEVR